MPFITPTYFKKYDTIWFKVKTALKCLNMTRQLYYTAIIIIIFTIQSIQTHDNRQTSHKSRLFCDAINGRRPTQISHTIFKTIKGNLAPKMSTKRNSSHNFKNKRLTLSSVEHVKSGSSVRCKLANNHGKILLSSGLFMVPRYCPTTQPTQNLSKSRHSLSSSIDTNEYSLAKATM